MIITELISRFSGPWWASSLTSNRSLGVTGIRVTKAYTNSKREIEKFREGDRQFVDASRRAYRAMAMFQSCRTSLESS